MVLDLSSPAHTLWKTDLYRIQLEAPVPIPILCDDLLPDRPYFLGQDYHGAISHIQAAQLLDTKENGAYLVRTSRSANGEFYTLSLKFNGKIHHYKLYFDPDGALYVGEKRYDCARSLVADGLVTMYIELKAPTILQKLTSVNYQESPYMTLTLNKRKLRILSKQNLVKQNALGNLNDDNGNNNPYTTTDQLSAQTLNDKAEKPHLFKLTTFKGLNWCELCANFLWGFTLQGKKCDDCGVIAHIKCSEKFANDCIPDLKYMRGVFGIELTTLLCAYKANLPFVVTKCVAEVEARGLTTEGIYRLSGFADEIDAIKMAFDKDGEKADLSMEKYPNINVITGALKLYLRILPVPLITFEVHPRLIDAIQHNDMDVQLTSIKHALLLLPKSHYDSLRFMIQHLHRVARHAPINKMNALNLATVFAPTLIHHPPNIIPDVRSDILLLELMINKCDGVFLKSQSP
ncbi:beta-chimaerin-like [Anthonomus grandis grandis]|uniref:beta-chimaerin-like n=1 Tax=Anthonomus grandis grandis TaxID=2921223 RepID=UPI002165FB31|nr:beta-chimaerin-like [Anthonomus grandis grandis]XP_050298921.1 beta-chimaerin-like [Anthonomus grandis grandis]